MSNAVIDKKSEKNSFGFLTMKAHVDTTLTLVEMEEGKTGVLYETVFSGLKDGRMNGGPFVISKNTTRQVNDSPEVNVIVSEFDKQQDAVSMRITITVDIPVLGKQTIYNQTLAGKCTSQVG
ncbi:hypothetical protein [Oceanobacter mangrovi]|uniref:hypothetical protein n=1 Tax=Oceanobacter mangrovi TaxID=2862510 RepID=UPI001C8ED421|nr:hypothetical protein [Oceanobacter mangrovi]